MSFSIVVPTVGRASLGELLRSLAACDGPRPDAIVVVDDRRVADPPLELDVAGWPAGILQVRRSGGRGPAAARNVGWRAVTSEWVVFLDDDVRVMATWLERLAADLADAGPDVAASTARINVPLPSQWQRRPTDWERSTAGLATSTWITADIAYRRRVLRELNGFDERFLRAFREDADLGLRTVDAGYRIVAGTRCTVHPVRPAPWWVSIAMQRGNADDALMRALHGADWHARAAAPVGRRNRHLVTTLAGVLAVAAGAARRPVLAGIASAGWAAATAEFARARIAPGPRTPGEVATMIATSAAIPPFATWYWLRGRVRHHGAPPWPRLGSAPIAAVLVDRDGTIVRDVPYNGEPERVEPMPGARAALDRLRAAGIKVGVISNQSGVARGRLTLPQVSAVNRRVEELLGPFAVWEICPHGEDDGCSCRKPAPGMVLAAARELGVQPERCVVLGDTGADVAAAEAAGAAGVLIPNEATLPQEIEAAPFVFRRLDDAVDALLAAAEARQ